MSDLVGNHIVGFPTRRLIFLFLVFQDMSIDYYTDYESEKLSWAEEDRYFNQAISQLSQDFRWVR